jgi:hypothetical protein
MENKGKKVMNRRKFIGGSMAAAATVSIVPRHVLGGVGFKAPSDTLNIAGVGVGGMGFGNLDNMDFRKHRRVFVMWTGNMPMAYLMIPKSKEDLGFQRNV